MTTLSPTENLALPEQLVGQGLDSNQEESGNRAIYILLTHDTVGPTTDLVATYRDGAYEVWAARGMVRFQRVRENGRFAYQILETIGVNPIAKQDGTAVSTLDEELAAATASGNATGDPNKAFIEPEHLTYPLAYERIAQLFDSPNAPDLAVNPKAFAFGRQPGQHGALDVVQSRAPLVFSGPGARRGVADGPARHIDIAPTIAKLMGFPTIVGRNAAGEESADVYFRRQDGSPLDEVAEADGDATPERVYILHLDGLSNSELRWQLEQAGVSDIIPNLRGLIDRGVMFRYGSIVNFPSITWPSHNAIGTSCWCGHHDIVNPTYYLREKREVVTPQGQQFDSAKYLSDGVETLYEAFHRVYGPWQGQEGALTAAIHEPCTRGADHSVLERRVVGDRERLREVTQQAAEDTSSLWYDIEHKPAVNEATVDTRGVAQVLVLFSEDDHPAPMFTFHEFTLTDGVGHDFGPHSAELRTALAETDKRIGRILTMLKDRSLFGSTLFIITADHGMAPTKTELAADQPAILPVEGMKAVVPAPLVYLIDMAIDIEHARDGRTATITALANDVDESGEQPPIAKAEVMLSGQGGKVLGRAETDAFGVCGVPLPVEVPAHELLLTVHHDDYNPRHLRIDGSNVTIDLRELLYGS